MTPAIARHFATLGGLSQTLACVSHIVGEHVPMPDGLGFGPMYVDETGVWFSTYDEELRVLVAHLDARTFRVDARSRPIDSYYTDAAFDPSSGSVWVAAPLGSITRMDTR